MDASLSGGGRARDGALAALARIHQGAHVSAALASTRSFAGPDRALATQLVYGVLRQQRYLDAWITMWRQGPLDVTVRDILRLAFFQLGFLDRVPAYAAVHAAVEQAKVRAPGAKGLVNAVLRRGQGHPPSPESLSLGERYSHPDWIVKRWAKRYGTNLEKVLQADNEIAPIMLRVNLERATRDQVLEQLRQAGFKAMASPYLPEAIRVDGALWLEDLAAFKEGIVTVQDESGMLVNWVLDVQKDEAVIDLAVGVGGKAIHALERQRGIRLTGLDISQQRLKLYQQNLVRCGYSDRAMMVSMPAQQYAPTHEELYDRAILDAPCSGLGVLRRRVDARWGKQAERFPELRARQLALLGAARQVVVPDGVIVYSTCSTEPEETGEVVQAALEKWPDLWLEDVGPFLPHPALRSYVQQSCLVLAPGDLQMDGFFIARIRKRGDKVGKNPHRPG